MILVEDTRETGIEQKNVERKLMRWNQIEGLTVVDRVYKKKVGRGHYNQYYPRVRTKKLGWMSYSSASLTLAIFCNQLFCQKILRKIGIFKKF